MEKNLQMSLKTKWFEMTKAGIKKEDYREVTTYWKKRLCEVYNDNPKFICFKEFSKNIMTLGYPKSGDAERILKLEHKGIEIRTGNTEWGAEPGKLYFVIKHGDIINN